MKSTLINLKGKTKMKTIAISLIALGAALAGTAQAEGKWSGNLAVANDYIWRGVSQTNGDAAISGGVDYANGMFYAGAWASNVKVFANSEIDAYLGVKPTLGKATFDLGAIWYTYDESSLNATELKAGVSYPIGKGSVGGAVYFSTNGSGSKYYELTGSAPLTDKLSVSGGVGQYDNDGYTNGNIGLTYQINDRFALDTRYSRTDVKKVNLMGVTLFKEFAPQMTVSLKAAF